MAVFLWLTLIYVNISCLKCKLITTAPVQDFTFISVWNHCVRNLAILIMEFLLNISLHQCLSPYIILFIISIKAWERWKLILKTVITRTLKYYIVGTQTALRLVESLISLWKLKIFIYHCLVMYKIFLSYSFSSK